MNYSHYKHFFTDRSEESLWPHLLGSVSLQQGEGRGEGGGEVGDLHGLDVVDGLGELGDVLVGGLHQLGLPVAVGEALDQRLGLVREGEHRDEVVLAERLHDVDHDVLGDLLPQASHGAGRVQEDDDVLQILDIWFDLD